MENIFPFIKVVVAVVINGARPTKTTPFHMGSLEGFLGVEGIAT